MVTFKEFLAHQRSKDVPSVRVLYLEQTLLALLLIVPVANSSAQNRRMTLNEYAKAIHETVQRRWEADSYSSELVPSSICAVRIVQMPGGDVLSVDVLPDCAFNQSGRRSIVDAVRQSSPLPYYGFESVFQREIRIVFHAANTNDRQAHSAMLAETERVREDSAALDRQWAATVGVRRRRDEYINRCSFHLLWQMPKIELSAPTSVIITIDKEGKVVGVADTKKEPVDGQLLAAFGAVPPCEPIPTDLVAGAGTIEIGPIVVGNRGQ